jgi:hypothetical protein
VLSWFVIVYLLSDLSADLSDLSWSVLHLLSSSDLVPEDFVLFRGGISDFDLLTSGVEISAVALASTLSVVTSPVVSTGFTSATASLVTTLLLSVTVLLNTIPSQLCVRLRLSTVSRARLPWKGQLTSTMIFLISLSLLRMLKFWHCCVCNPRKFAGMIVVALLLILVALLLIVLQLLALELLVSELLLLVCSTEPLVVCSAVLVVCSAVLELLLTVFEMMHVHCI